MPERHAKIDPFGTRVIVWRPLSAQIRKEYEPFAARRSLRRHSCHLIERIHIQDLVHKPFHCNTTAQVGSHQHPQIFLHMAERVRAVLFIIQRFIKSARYLACRPNISCQCPRSDDAVAHALHQGVATATGNLYAGLQSCHFRAFLRHCSDHIT